MRQLAAGPRSPAAYAGYLRVMAAVHEPVEGALARASHPAVAAVWRADMRRLDAVYRDLAALHASAPAPATPADVDLADPIALLGALYVLEGARLGGVVLRRAVARALGRDEPDGFTYLSGGETGVRTRWARFGRRMNAALLADDQHRRATAGATATFAWIDRLIDAVPPA